MMALELGSTGAAEISVFQRLPLGNGRNPPRLSFCPGVICWHEELELPVPPPPDPPEPPVPPELPEPAPEPLLFPVLEVVALQPAKKSKGRARQSRRNAFQGEAMVYFFAGTFLVEENVGRW